MSVEPSKEYAPTKAYAADGTDLGTFQSPFLAKARKEEVAIQAAKAVASQSGYTACACRDCMDTTVSSDVTKPELCAECTEAGCEPYPVALASIDHLVTPASVFECQRADAYGDDPERSCGCGAQGVHGVDHGDYPDA